LKAPHFTERRHQHPVNPPPCLPDPVRVSSIKILGVTFTSKLSVSDHINSVMSSCAQSMHALRTLRSHGMDTELLQTVYRAAIIVKLLYASSAWCGFTTASDWQCHIWSIEPRHFQGPQTQISRSAIL